MVEFVSLLPPSVIEGRINPHFPSMGLFQTYYQQNLLSTYSASAISWIFTTQLFLM
jgi:hypothetical protein